MQNMALDSSEYSAVSSLTTRWWMLHRAFGAIFLSNVINSTNALICFSFHKTSVITGNSCNFLLSSYDVLMFKLSSFLHTLWDAETTAQVDGLLKWSTLCFPSLNILFITRQNNRSYKRMKNTSKYNEIVYLKTSAVAMFIIYTSATLCAANLQHRYIP